MDTDASSGQMSLNIKDPLRITIFMALEHMCGLTSAPIKVIGNIIKCTVKVSLHGWTAESMKVSTMMIKSMVKAFSFGLMVRSTTENGFMESSMVSDGIGKAQKQKKEKVNGLMARESDGLIAMNDQ